ncbi:uncharacterized protein LOC134188300 [Corticium candelabrum]|uniref:uncharacterized protein LOC134188300 n=1 Tax=Corticium candelabrum TaxID=121492 RepID=UPI002E26D9DC|nr:uncharacterized protein LOC134188300 [Corticium candelabrum]
MSCTALFWSLLLLFCFANGTHLVGANPAVAKQLDTGMPSSWTREGCSMCSCDFVSKTVNCSGIDLHDGLPSASVFPTDMTVFLFQNCSVSVIDPNYFLNFSSLERIHGNDNKLKESFFLPPKIVTLQLRDNYVTNASAFFQRHLYNYSYLNTFDLRGNSIQRIETRGISDIPNLTLLYLDNMRKGLVLDNEAISNLPGLAELYLSNNNMTLASLQGCHNLAKKSRSL